MTPARWLCFAALAVTPLVRAADPVNLTYPPPGTEAPVVNVAAGQSNTGVRLSPAEARARAKRYARGHLIIGSDFSVTEPPAPTEAEPKAAPAAKTEPAVKLQNPSPTVNRHQVGLLWRVEKPGYTPSHLFGTIHSEDPRVLALPPAVKKTFDSARSFTAEMRLDRNDPDAFNTAMVFNDGRTLASVAGDTLAEKTAALLKQRNIPARLTESLKPLAAAILLSTPKPKTGVVLDLSLFRQAKRVGKPVYGLETLDEQFAALDTVPLEDQVALLRQTVADYPRLGQLTNAMVNTYLSRDLTDLKELAHESSPGDHLAGDSFFSALVDTRNRRMVKRMLPRLKEGDAFIAVGALHLPDRQGVLQLLRNRGFKVTPVY